MVFVFTTLFISFSILAQTSSDYKIARQLNEDSLLKSLKTLSSDSAKAEVYSFLMSSALMNHPENVEKWYREGFVYAERSGNQDLVVKFNVRRITGWNKLGQHYLAYQEALKLEKQMALVKIPRVILAFYLEYAAACARLSMYSKATELYQKSISLARSFKQTDIEITALNNFSVLYNDTNKWVEMKELLEQVIRLAQKNKMRAEETMGRFNLALVESNQGNYGKAVDYLNETLHVFDSLGNRLGWHMHTLALVQVILN